MFDINNIDMILSITIAYFGGSFFLTIFFYNLYYLQKKPYLLKWISAWFLLSLGYICLFLAIKIPSDHLYGLYSLLIITYAFMFLRASSSFLNFTLSKYLKHIMLTLYLVIIISTIYVQYVGWGVLIAFVALSVFFFLVGLKFMKGKDFFNRITGYIIIVFSVLSFFYPFFATQDWFMPWGYIVMGLLGFFIGISLIQIHFQAQKTELELMKNKLHYMAHHDSLTEVYNRLFMDNEFLKIEKEKTSNVGLLFIDINNFKQINDTYGHRKGDEILFHVSQVFRDVVKDEGKIIRFGGDEFIILFYNSTIEKTNLYKNKLLNFSNNHKINNIKVYFAVGSSFRSDKIEDMYHLVDIAEKEMYINKNVQKNNGQ